MGSRMCKTLRLSRTRNNCKRYLWSLGFELGCFSTLSLSILCFALNMVHEQRHSWKRTDVVLLQRSSLGFASSSHLLVHHYHAHGCSLGYWRRQESGRFSRD